GVDPDRPEGAGAVARGDAVAQGEPPHEAGEHQARGPDAVAQQQAGPAEPERLVEQRRGPRDQEDRAQDRGHAAPLRWWISRASRYATRATSSRALSPIAIEANSSSPPATAPSRFQPKAIAARSRSRKSEANESAAKKTGAPTKRTESASLAAGPDPVSS